MQLSIVLHALSKISDLHAGNDENKVTRDRYNIDSKAGRRLIRAIAVMIADAAALEEPGAREAFVDGTIKDIIKTRLVQPAWGSLFIDEIAPRLRAAVDALVGGLLWVGAKDNPETH